MAGRARSTSHRVFVRPAVPLPLDALDSYFSRFGQVTDVYAPKSSSRPVAFVSFLDPEAVERVMASQTHMIAGVRVHAERATPRGGRDGGSGHPSPQWPEAQPGMQPPQLVLAAEAVFSGVPPPVSAMHAGQLQAAARDALSRSFPVRFASLAPGPSPMLHVVFDDSDAHGLPVLARGQQFPVAADILLTVVSFSVPSRVMSTVGSSRRQDSHDAAPEWSEGHSAGDKAMPLPDFGDARPGEGVFSGPLRRQSDTQLRRQGPVPQLGRVTVERSPRSLAQHGAAGHGAWPDLADASAHDRRPSLPASQFASRPPPGIAALVHSEGRAPASIRRDSGFCSTTNTFSAISEGDARGSSAVSVSAVPPTRTSNLSRSRPSVAAGLWDGSAQIVDIADSSDLPHPPLQKTAGAGHASGGTSAQASPGKVLIGVTRHSHLAQLAPQAAPEAGEASSGPMDAGKRAAGKPQDSALKVASRIVPVPVGQLLFKEPSKGPSCGAGVASCTDSASPRSSEDDEDEDAPSSSAAGGARSGEDSPVPVSVCAASAAATGGSAAPPPPPPPPRPASLSLRVSASDKDGHADADVDADAKEAGPTTPSMENVRSPVGPLSPTPGTPVASAHSGASHRDAAAAAARLAAEVEASRGASRPDGASHRDSELLHDGATHHGAAQAEPSSVLRAASTAARRASAPPAPGVAGSCRIFINAVPPHVTEADVVDHFSRFGPVTDVYFPVFHTVVSGGTHGHASSVPTTKRRGFCFVTMAVDADVDAAIAYSDRIIAGSHVPEMRRARPRSGGAAQSPPLAVMQHRHSMTVPRSPMVASERRRHAVPVSGGIAYGRVATSCHPGSLGSHLGAEVSRSVGLVTSVPPALAEGLVATSSGLGQTAAPIREPTPASSGMHPASAAMAESDAHAGWAAARGDAPRARVAESDLADADGSSPLAAAQLPLRMSAALDSGLTAQSDALGGLDDHAGMVAARSAFALLSLEDEASALCPGPIVGGASAVFAQEHGTGFW
ncbi:hypothetical protein FNF29_01529 [Cafeteria roenbergensis]|uniref:RRM domain-containing protein n=1 Tax=Cafeteria roenbergensis TaxID=33653 RepID=A0A5A8CR88_CAFRO|nr:hypothetical protein FNF29_01529 [Cafeteria roenbergensis]|eukprot:KAA0155612.1 hypothetical protein FNF29_01529 [Cafeteria roenbergensis]